LGAEKVRFGFFGALKKCVLDFFGALKKCDLDFFWALKSAFWIFLVFDETEAYNRQLRIRVM
jgi:hypothetical protein